MKPLEIQTIAHLPMHIRALESEAIAEGFRFLTRLISEWHSGANRFDAPGECLMAAYSNQQLIGIAGLSIDPHGKPGTALSERSSFRQYHWRRRVFQLIKVFTLDGSG